MKHINTNSPISQLNAHDRKDTIHYELMIQFLLYVILYVSNKHIRKITSPILDITWTTPDKKNSVQILNIKDYKA